MLGVKSAWLFYDTDNKLKDVLAYICHNKHMKWLSLYVLFIPLLASCSQEGDYVTLKGQNFSVEVVSTPDQRQLGLMYRRSMDMQHGMLFIFEDEQPRSFWMKNTKIALDILYFDEKQRLISQQLNARPCKADPCPAYPSEGAAMYVLELNAGQAHKLKLLPDEKIEFYLN